MHKKNAAREAAQARESTKHSINPSKSGWKANKSACLFEELHAHTIKSNPLEFLLQLAPNGGFTRPGA